MLINDLLNHPVSPALPSNTLLNVTLVAYSTGQYKNKDSVVDYLELTLKDEHHTYKPIKLYQRAAFDEVAKFIDIICHHYQDFTAPTTGALVKMTTQPIPLYVERVEKVGATGSVTTYHNYLFNYRGTALTEQSLNASDLV